MRQPQTMFGNRQHAGHYPETDNTPAVVTVAAIEGNRHVVSRVVCSYDADPTGGRITVTIGSDTVLDQFITHSGLAPFELEVYGEPNAAVTATLAAGGSNVTGKLDVYYL